jgi:small subunit ribosomal protein S7
MRGQRAVKRVLAPDPIYNSRLVSRFINKVMYDGKKSIAQRLVYEALEQVEKTGKKPMQVFETALQNVSPKMEVRRCILPGSNRGER